MARTYETGRAPFVAKFIEANPVCQVCWRARSVTVHEPLTRAHGGPIDDENNAVAVCGTCHGEIHDHVAESIAAGWLVPSWEATA